MTAPTTRRTRADEVADDLRARILAGALEPGAALRETELEAFYTVSRHTVRRALSLLVAERLATARAYHGVTVAPVGVDALVAVQELRCALESEAVRLLRVRHGAAWPASVTGPIEAALGDLARATARPAEGAAVDAAHSSVHRALVRAAGSPRITEAFDALDAELTLFLRHIRPDLEVSRLADEHRAFIEAARVHGEGAVRAHLDASTALLTGALGDGASDAS